MLSILLQYAAGAHTKKLLIFKCTLEGNDSLKNAVHKGNGRATHSWTKLMIVAGGETAPGTNKK